MFKRCIPLLLLALLALSVPATQAQSLNDLWRESWGTCSGLPCLSVKNATSSGPWTGSDTLNDLLKLSFDTCSGVPCMRVSIDGGGTTIPAPGNNTEVLFNDSGVIGADAGFTYVKATDTATVGALLATTVNKLTLTPPASAATLTIADGKTLTVSNILTLTGTDSSSVAFGTGGTVAYTVAHGTQALGTGAIASGTCATVVTTTATGTATTDVVTIGFNGDPTGVTGYVPLSTGMLTIITYPGSNNINTKVCNNTSDSITPGAITLNWRVAR